VDKIFYLEEAGWIKPAVSGENIDLTNKGVGVMKPV